MSKAKIKVESTACLPRYLFSGNQIVSNDCQICDQASFFSSLLFPSFHNTTNRNHNTMQNTKITPEEVSLDPEHRRSFVEEHFQKHSIWNDAEWDSLLKKTEEKLCQLLATAKYVKVSQAYFNLSLKSSPGESMVSRC
jgi:hypothetical protein